MEIERLPHLVLANSLALVVEGILEMDDQERRLLLNQFSEVLRPLCKATEEAFLRGFDDGAKYIIGRWI